MARCEDWPCCGHEAGCCPDFDEDGRQLNMKCVCGATLPLNSRFSICDSCMRQGDDDEPGGRFDYERDEDMVTDDDDDRYLDGLEDIDAFTTED